MLEFISKSILKIFCFLIPNKISNTVSDCYQFCKQSIVSWKIDSKLVMGLTFIVGNIISAFISYTLRMYFKKYIVVVFSIVYVVANLLTYFCIHQIHANRDPENQERTENLVLAVQTFLCLISIAVYFIVRWYLEKRYAADLHNQRFGKDIYYY